jgi:hypothetical protein
MALLLAEGKAKSIREAARMVAPQAQGPYTLKAHVDRLRKKYVKYQKELEAWAQAELQPPPPPLPPRRSPPLTAASAAKLDHVAAAKLDRNDAARPPRERLNAASSPPSSFRDLTRRIEETGNDTLDAMLERERERQELLRNPLKDSLLEKLRRILKE